MKIPLSAITANPEQPRREFDPGALRELADSIAANGLINAIAVEAAPGGKYILIDGERRYRAHQLLKRKTIEATIFPARSSEARKERLMQAMVANVQRSDLTPMEEARAYAELRDLGMAVNEIAKAMGVSLSKVYARLELVTFPEGVQQLFHGGTLSPDIKVPTALKSITNPIDQLRLANRFAQLGMRIPGIVKAVKMYHGERRAKPAETGIPAIDQARRRLRRDTAPSWSQLQAAGHLPAWSIVLGAAEASCHACSLFVMASEAVCRECPAVELIRAILERADETK